MKWAFLGISGVFADVPVCETHWQDTFMVEKDGDTSPKFSLSALGISPGTVSPNGAKEGEGTYESSVYACVACFNELANTKGCGSILGSSCHAYDVMTGFGTHEVEQVEAGNDHKTKKKIKDSEMELWTYAVDAGEGVPEGAQNCGPIVYKARNPKATQQIVDAACSRNDAFCETEKSTFEECCTGMVPENQLCSDGKHCCGAENTVTIGKTVKEAEALCEQEKGSAN
jgi:hypothetical protein